MQNIDGWFSVWEALTFYEIAKRCTGRGVAVEIGSWQGKSTVCIARGSIDGAQGMKVYAIDPHVGSEEHQDDGDVWTFESFKKNLEDFGVTDIVTPIVKFSHDAVDDVTEDIEFLFIDGAHDYDSVDKDFGDWFPKVLDGGTIAFHDSHWTGVRRVLGETVYPHHNVRRVRRVMGTTIIEKGVPRSLWERLAKYLTWLGFEMPLRWKTLRRRITGRKVPEFT
jgi:predicted O-methyltransferase YrrM